MKQSLDVIYVNFLCYEEIKKSIKSFCVLVESLDIEFNIFIFDNSFHITNSLIIHKFQEDLNKFKLVKNIFIKFYPSNSNYGFGSGCNKAVREGSSEKIIIVNPDTRFDKTDPIYFQEFIKECNEKDVIIGPKIVNEKGLIHASCFSFDPVSIFFKPLRHIRHIGNKTKFIPEYKFFKKRIDRITYEGLSKDKESYVDWVSGCFMIVNRDFYELVNGFDERFFLYFEDVDLCRKARQLGKNVVYSPKIKITHYAAHQSRSKKGLLKSIFFNKTARYHIFAWLKYIFKWRMDFLRKLLNKINNKFHNSEQLKSDIYKMDFSTFEYKSLDSKKK